LKIPVIPEFDIAKFSNSLSVNAQKKEKSLTFEIKKASSQNKTKPFLYFGI
jgi:hypothetical protein